MQKNKIKIGFFGSSKFSVLILDELEKAGLVPHIVVTTPDKPQGRKMILTATPVKVWAEQRNIKAYSPAKLNPDFAEELKRDGLDVFIVASYGKIIPEAFLDIPKARTLNVHPSLLPQYRGPSPLQTAILNDTKKTGVTIIRLDKEMDHGPILAAKEVEIEKWPTYEEFEQIMAKAGADLLISILPGWIEGKIAEKEQDHDQATFTKKISKEDGEIDLKGDPYEIWRKIQAFHEWPKAYFWTKKEDKKIRIKITEADFDFASNSLNILKVIPEGSREMSYGDFQKGYNRE